MNVNEQMLSKFKKFLNDISNVYPEHKESINNNYKDILNCDELKIEDNELITEFLEKISNISDDIMNKDDSIFTDDLYLLKDISMKSLWSSDISNKTKESIWGYLNIFCLIELNISSGKIMQKTNEKLNSGEKITKKELKLMKEFKKLSENINNSNSSFTQESFSELENTSLGNLAKEITDGLDINENNAQDMLKPDNMMNLFQSINSTIQQKVENNEIDMNALFGEATGFMNNNGMMENMMGMVGNLMGQGGGEDMPDLSSMMNMMSQMAPPQQQQQSQQSNNSNSKASNNHDPNVVRDRLRKKLQSKN